MPLTDAQRLELITDEIGLEGMSVMDLEYGPRAGLAGILSCPYGDSGHFMHDGCPTCAFVVPDGAFANHATDAEYEP